MFGSRRQGSGPREPTSAARVLLSPSKTGESADLFECGQELFCYVPPGGHSDVYIRRYTNPKRKRGSGLWTSLTLRVSGKPITGVSGEFPAGEIRLGSCLRRRPGPRSRRQVAFPARQETWGRGKELRNRLPCILPAGRSWASFIFLPKNDVLFRFF